MIITPYQSVSGIAFGAPRAVAQENLAGSFTSGEKKFGGIVDRYDHFIDLGIFVFYNDQDEVTAFEFFDAPGPELFGIPLLAVSYSELLDSLREWDVNLIVEPSGIFTSHELGIAGMPPGDGSSTSPAESVMAFARGYYEA